MYVSDIHTGWIRTQDCLPTNVQYLGGAANVDPARTTHTGQDPVSQPDIL